MNITSAARARLYALTAVACAIWLVQTCVEANNAGELFSWSNVIFSICLIIVTGYCAVNAVLGWNTKERHSQATQTNTPNEYDAVNTQWGVRGPRTPHFRMSAP